ncbi:hypothetical protein MRB53_024704 [Persea americana]|uniref:Uncharacterized protein n=1 Tax=Persea americana TaxID=3435 RepID=A0ACC2LD75_PERAE|nr:hypothetical protein MRB53_024704 [Persea americana]
MSKSPEEEHPQKAFGWAARDASGILSPFNFSRRANGDDDVTVKILYCGICHADLHYVKNEFGHSSYPLVPGHKITGIVTAVGPKVEQRAVSTFNAIDHDGTRTYGGYSDIIVVNQHYVIRFPNSLPLDKGTPLLCAGITVYSPMKYYGLCGPGTRLGVVGLGGLGHVAVKFAKAFGMKVTVISTSPSKGKEAIERLGADSFLVSSDSEQMKAAMGTLDGILDTVSAFHPISPLIDLLTTNGKLILLGAPEKPLELSVFPLLMGRKLVGGSGIGGMREIQEMMDFAGAHNISADIEIIPMDYVNTALDRLARGDVRYRFVIDVGTTLTA